MSLHKPDGLHRYPKLGGSSQISPDDGLSSMDSRVGGSPTVLQEYPRETSEQKIRKLIKQLQDRVNRLKYLQKAEAVLIYSPKNGAIPETLKVDKAKRHVKENERVERLKAELSAE